MAEGLLRRYGENRYEAYSAGTAPVDAVHPLAIEAMADLGIDIRSISGGVNEECVITVAWVMNTRRKHETSGFCVR